MSDILKEIKMELVDTVELIDIIENTILRIKYKKGVRCFDIPNIDEDTNIYTIGDKGYNIVAKEYIGINLIQTDILLQNSL